jgi:hypothetical protein
VFSCSLLKTSQNRWRLLLRQSPCDWFDGFVLWSMVDFGVFNVGHVILNIMLYEREKCLLNLLLALGGRIGALDFQKLLFLFCQEMEKKPCYDFVPYRFGAFSFTSYADKRRLISAGLLENDDQTWHLTLVGRETAQKTAVDKTRVTSFSHRYGNLRGNALIEETYRRYPYHATRSEMLNRLELEPEALCRIESARPVRVGAGLLTIGYECRSLEAYLNLLLQAGVNVLCDVRRNPLSRKYGFAKNTLSKASNGVGIRYEHMPELGIASQDRRGLETQSDYDALFTAYKRDWLPGQTGTLDKIRGWLEKGERVALTCYELCPEQCHRHCVAEMLERGPGAHCKVAHL